MDTTDFSNGPGDEVNRTCNILWAWHTSLTQFILSQCRPLELAVVSKATPTSKVSLWTEFLVDLVSLVPRPSPAPVFDRLQYAKTGAREGLGTRLDLVA